MLGREDVIAIMNTMERLWAELDVIPVGGEGREDVEARLESVWLQWQAMHE